MDRLRKVLQGLAGRKKRNGGLKPFKNLRLEELREECQARGLPTDGKKKDLEETLREEMRAQMLLLAGNILCKI